MSKNPFVSTASGVRILLVEDNDINRQLLGDYLNYCGHEVVGIEDGSQFFQTMSWFEPHLVLLDLKLPGIDGYSLLEQLQQHPQFRHTPVIVISAYAFEVDQHRALNLGASKYLVKPLKLEILENEIHSAIQQVCLVQ
jgi:two-component system, cell cycle response regulator DivK